MECPSCGRAVDPDCEFCPECYGLLAKKQPAMVEARKGRLRAAAPVEKRPGVSPGALTYFAICIFVLGFAAGYWVHGVQAGRSQAGVVRPMSQMGLDSLEGLPPGHPPIDGTPRPAPPLDPALVGLRTDAGTPRVEVEPSPSAGVQEDEP